jgi:hypothetical protein
MKKHWLAYECLNGPCGTMADIRLDGPDDGIAFADVPVLSCPRCEALMVWQGKWEAYGSRGGDYHHDGCPRATECSCTTHEPGCPMAPVCTCGMDEARARTKSTLADRMA